MGLPGANPGLTIGYGIGTWVFYLIPFVVFVAPPVVAAGATLAFIDTERKKGRLPAAPSLQKVSKKW